MIRPILMLALAGTLGACGQRDDGTSIAVNTGGGVGAFDGKTGEVRIDTPMFKGAFKLPKVTMTADNFDLNGVHLFPGSTVESVDVAGQQDGKVSVRFASPATPASVQAWFRREFEKAGTPVRVEGSGLSGGTGQDAFRIELSPRGSTGATGVVRIG